MSVIVSAGCALVCPQLRHHARQLGLLWFFSIQPRVENHAVIT